MSAASSLRPLFSGPREIALDIETTGLRADQGHRIVEIGAVELRGGRPTGLEFHARLNPERDVPPENARIHGLTNEILAQAPRFAAVAEELKKFIGSSPIVITCRTGAGGYVLDRDFMAAEMKNAGHAPFPDSQWINVRLWSEELFGNDNARLDSMLDRYGLSRKERDEKGHGALLDARLLAQVYPKLRRDYLKFRAGGKQGATPAP